MNRLGVLDAMEGKGDQNAAFQIVTLSALYLLRDSITPHWEGTED